MDNLQTIGQERHKGLVVKIHYSTDVGVLDVTGRTLFQILYIDEGAVVIGDENEEKALITPVLLCLNYKEKQKTIHLKNAKGYSIFFEPEAVNHGLMGNEYNSNGDKIKSGATGAENGDASGANGGGDYFQTEELLIYPFRKSNKDNPVYLPVSGSVRERLLRIASDMKDQFYAQPDDYWPCRGRSFFIEMLMLLQSLYKLQIDNAIDIDTTDKTIVPVIKEIQLNYGSVDFTTKCLKKKNLLGTGLTYLKKKGAFKKITGESPALYLEKHRITVGANLLKDTILRISEIARRCGYESEEAFETVFFKHKEMSPATWRASFPNPYG